MRKSACWDLIFEKEVTSARADAHERLDALLARHVMLGRFELIVAEAAADAAALLPRMLYLVALRRAFRVAVFGRIVPAVAAAAITPPAVVFNDRVLNFHYH